MKTKKLKNIDFTGFISFLTVHDFNFEKSEKIFENLFKKQIFCVFFCDFCNRFGGHIFDFRNLFYDVFQISGIVSFAPVGCGCKIRAVRFDEDAFDGDGLYHFHQFFGIGESDNTANADMEAHFYIVQCHFRRAGVTMDGTTADIGTGNDVKRILRGFSGMDDNGKPGFLRQSELLDEPEALEFTGVGIVMIIQTDFTDGNDLFVFAQFSQLINGLRGHIVEFMGMYADGSVDVIIFIRHAYAHFRAFYITADIDDMTYPGSREKLLQELLSIFSESLIVIMCVGFKIFHFD